METKEARFKKGHEINSIIEYIDWHLSLVDKNGWGGDNYYSVNFKKANLNAYSNQFFYIKNDVITRDSHIKGMTAFLNSLKNDLKNEFKRL